MIKVTILQKTNGTWQFGKIGVLVNFIIQKLKFYKIAQVFFNFSRERKFERFERIERISFSENPGLDLYVFYKFLAKCR